MMKRFMCGALAAAVAFSALAVAPSADAAKAPKAKYTFNMNKKSKKVVAVARKKDTANYTTSNTETGTLPEAKNAKKVKLKYVKGKHGKALYLDRTSSYGAELKGVKLGSKSWTVSFWVKSANKVSDYMAIFFTGNNIVNPKKTKWLSITASSWLDGGNCPVVWSHNAANGQFPWYAYQDEEGTWVGDVAVKPNKWVHITVVVDTKDTCEYGTAGEEGYVKSYHAWTYVNGKLYGNGTVAKGTMSNSNKFFLGINAWDTPFKGYFDDVKLFNKALTAKQVKALYKSVK
ncbi:MAG: LamG domain-containing protein [Eubacterium sp.]|nr:LamG domain-containing protein [Eubacterium sp.]